MFCSLSSLPGGGLQAAQSGISQEYAAQHPMRIVDRVDDSRLTVLKGNTHPLATPANDRGVVLPELPIRRLLMVLRRSPEQELALDKLMMAQQDPGSPLFHKWLTPEQFGDSFGPAAQDVDSIKSWLGSHGFTEIKVSDGMTVVEFSGNAGQVQSAFHTAIHRYQADGALHLANQSDPSIPTALVPVVAGVVSMNDFGRHSMAIRGPTLESSKGQLRPQIVPGASPDFSVPGPTLQSSFFGVAPYDFATIYDLLPLWNAGFDGTGQTIAIVGQTDINLNDPKFFRSFLGLPARDPSVLIAGPDPGVQPDELESDLDVEWSGPLRRARMWNL
jgi:subtilase family serine protease